MTEINPTTQDRRAPILVSFYGGPGSGKSTASLSLTSKMKNAALRAEFVSEFAKTLAWNKGDLLAKDFMFPVLFGRQIERIFLPSSECDFIITDSPPWLGAAYAEMYGKNKETSKLFASYARGMHATGYDGLFSGVVDIELDRKNREYINCGRSQTREEACVIDASLSNQYNLIVEEMNKNGMSYFRKTYSFLDAPGAMDKISETLLKEVVDFRNKLEEIVE